MGRPLSLPAGTIAERRKPLSYPRSWQWHLYCWSCGVTIKTWQRLHPAGKYVMVLVWHGPVSLPLSHWQNAKQSGLSGRGWRKKHTHKYTPLYTPFKRTFLWNVWQILYKNLNMQRSFRLAGPQLAVSFFCVWSRMKESRLYWKVFCSGGRVDREWEKKSPSLALLEITTKEGDGGRVEQADCLESNKTKRLRGPRSSSGSSDWFQTIGLGPTRRESFKLLIVGSPSLKISVYSKHISLRSALWPTLIFFKVSRVAARTSRLSFMGLFLSGGDRDFGRAMCLTLKQPVKVERQHCPLFFHHFLLCLFQVGGDWPEMPRKVVLL